jgi:hypothetical protein
MKTKDYKVMLRAVEQALEICDNSTGFMEKIHQDICEGLRATRARLLQLTQASAGESSSSPF